MQTFEDLKAKLARDFSDLEKMQAGGRMAQVERAFKEQLIGQHCYEAEKSLNPGDLVVLKQTLGIKENEWLAYKGKLTHSL
jgi:hypothetical protein